MAQMPMGSKGNYVHVYDFRVKAGAGDEFIRLFDAFDYSEANPMHQSKAQVKDGILCRDVNDPDHFYLLGEWADIEEHARIRRQLADVIKPEFGRLIEGTGFIPTYARIVSSTPQHILDQGASFGEASSKRP
jgi:hypothetical protein